MRTLLVAAAACGLVALTAPRSAAQSCTQHTFIGDRPSHGQPGWHLGTQGLAHDRDHWYVTNTYNDKSRSLLWRIPVTTDLAADVACGSGGVSCRELSHLGLQPPYNHFGDPDHFEAPGGHGYVLVPVEGEGVEPSGILMIFRADETLEFLWWTALPGQRSAAWVAVDADGILYSSEFDSQALVNRFHLDWTSLKAASEGGVQPVLVPLDPVHLQDENGAPLDMDKVQGGEFSDDGRRLYLANGDGRNEAEPGEGLHVFTLQPAEGDPCGPGTGRCTVARRIERSHNSDDPGFSFEFHPGLNAGATGQEPEGLTYWDLDVEEGVPGMRGQLHAVLLDNDSTDAEEVYVKHYAFADSDGDPPVVACPAPVTAECESPTGVPAGSAQLSAFLAGASASDACTAQPRIGHDAPSAFPLGTTPVNFTATDDAGNTSACQAPVTVVDTAAPVVSVAVWPPTLWPPDHRLVPIEAQVTVADACGAATIELVSVSSSEADDGTGDGDAHADVQGAEYGTADTHLLLRAERSGSGGGREYRIVYRVVDRSGNASTAAAIVFVPHSR